MESILVSLRGRKIIADDLFGADPVTRRFGSDKSAAQHDESEHHASP
jgi:hypothetical protein